MFKFYLRAQYSIGLPVAVVATSQMVYVELRKILQFIIYDIFSVYFQFYFESYSKKISVQSVDIFICIRNYVIIAYCEYEKWIGKIVLEILQM